MTKLLLIDLDDTLWATKVNNKIALQQVYTALNWGQYFLCFEDYYAAYLPINHQLWKDYALGKVDKATLSLERLRRPFQGRLSLSEGEWRAVDASFLNAVRQQTGLCPHALETLRYLKGRYRICILSNGFASVQYDKLERSGLMPYVDAVVLSDEVGVHKPDPEIFRIALERMGCVAEESLMIGDSYVSDIVGASGSGIRSIWYSPEGYTLDCDAEVTPPIATITDLSELIHLL
ncbi:MAG: YjjG family noncanonical pyrimidine nucleotidase [Porphyromonadaceae bacterium]|nr:YjjG family noncanonical pyrimidine nucleotidase [Porphyromonadaceae bacterium]